MRRNKVIVILAMVFFMPSIAAYFFYYHPHYLPQKTINKGHFMHPAVLLEGFSGQAKWRLVLWYPEVCQDECQQELDQLGRIRLALGRRLYQIDQWLVTETSINQMDQELLHEHNIQLLQLTKRTPAINQVLTHTPQIFLVNPNAYLVLQYPLHASANHIFADMQHILKTSKSD